MQKQKAVVIIIVAIVIVASAGIFAYQYFSAKKGSYAEQIANWSTYTNPQYRFEFKYPLGWNPIDCPIVPPVWQQTKNNNVIECTMKGPGSLPTATTASAIFINLGDKNAYLNTIIYPGSSWDEFLKSVPEYGRSKPATINSYNAVRLDSPNNIHVGIQNPNGGYIVFNFTMPANIDTATFNQILSTFKFTK